MLFLVAEARNVDSLERRIGLVHLDKVLQPRLGEIIGQGLCVRELDDPHLLAVIQQIVEELLLDGGHPSWSVQNQASQLMLTVFVQLKQRFQQEIEGLVLGLDSGQLQIF